MRTKCLVRLVLILGLGIPGLVYRQAVAPNPPEEIVADMDATKASEPDSKYEYGVFIEHIGSLI
jgi:hypothetical protein